MTCTVHNVSIMRDSIVLFTATGAARGVSGHTGGPFDTTPEVCILQALFDQDKGKSYVVVRLVALVWRDAWALTGWTALSRYSVWLLIHSA